MASFQQIEVRKRWVDDNLSFCAQNKRIKWNGYETANIRSPLRGDDKNPSFSVNVEKGVFLDRGSGQAGTLTELADLMHIEPPPYVDGETTMKTFASIVQAEKKDHERAPMIKSTRAAMNEAEKKIDEQRLNFVLQIWDAGTPCKRHGYLEKKQMPIELAGQNVRVLPSDGRSLGKWDTVLPDAKAYSPITAKGQLLVPIKNCVTGTLQGIEVIPIPDERKTPKRSYGSKKLGVFEIGTGKASLVALCEGYATAVAVKRFVGNNARVLCCFGSENIAPVARELWRAVAGEVTFLIAADADPAGEKALEEVRAINSVSTESVIDARAIDLNKRDTLSPASISEPQAEEGILNLLIEGKQKKPGTCKDDWDDIIRKIGFERAKYVFFQLVTADTKYKVIENNRRKSSETVFSAYAAGSSDILEAPLPHIVSELVPRGLTVFTAKPKSGQGWICNDIIAGLLTGSSVFGLPVTQSSVLYFDFGQTRDWTIKRLAACCPDALKSRKRLWVMNDSPAVDANFLTDLYRFVLRHNIGLVIIDTWELAYQGQKKLFSALRTAARELDIAILIATHNLEFGKSVTGIADALLHLEISQKSVDGFPLTGVLHRTGRNLSNTANILLQWTNPGFTLAEMK